MGSSTIKVMGHSEFSSTFNNQVIKFLAHFKLPNGDTTSFSFEINTTPTVAACSTPTITPPSTFTTVLDYNVGGSAQ